MSEATTQVIKTLSNEMQRVAASAVGDASFVRFYRGTIVKMVAEKTYQVVVKEQTAEMTVYGSGVFKPMDKVWVIAPDNVKELNRMFILGSGSKSTEESDDHQILMQLVTDCANKLDVGVVVQESGQSTTNIMSQKAVTEFVNETAGSGVKGIVIGGTTLSMGPEQKVVIPIGTESASGVVKSCSTNTDNGVVIKSDGTMEVTSLNISKLIQEKDDILILDGGNAAGT